MNSISRVCSLSFKFLNLSTNLKASLPCMNSFTAGFIEDVIKNSNRVLVSLKCTECKEANYTVSKNKKNTTERLELNKYCPRCQKTTAHKESK